MKVQPSDIEWLLGEAGQAHLAEAAQCKGDSLKLVSRLRKTLSPARSHLVAEQVELRQRAARKFSQAHCMLFTRVALEQASGEPLAAYKARRFSSFDRVADLCCGIGGDAVAIGRQAEVTAVDRDPIISLLCQHNGHVTNSAVETVCTCASAIDLSQADAWHIDPDRRSTGNRTINPDAYSPSLSTIESMLSTNRHGAIKLAPASRFESLVGEFELEWIGRGRECQQQVAWFGDLAHRPRRRTATVLGGNGGVVGRVSGTGAESGRIEPLQEFVIEPHPAVIAAGLVNAFAQEHNLASLNPRIAYLTGKAPLHACHASCFAVLASMPFDERNLLKEFKSRDLYPEEVKKKQVDVDPAALTRRWRKAGSKPCTLVLTRMDDRVVAIVAERVQPPTTGPAANE